RASDGSLLLLKLEEQYDVYGRRIREDRWTAATGTVVLRFGYDGDNVLVDLDASDNVVARYVRPDGIDALGGRLVSGNAGWYLTDRQGSVVGLTNSSGALQGTISYGGFGNIASDPTWASGDRWKCAARENQRDVQSY